MKPKPLALEPGDYYFNEQGLLVFTAQYHTRRGSCCQSGCLHCPYGFRKDGKTTGKEPRNKSGLSG